MPIRVRNANGIHWGVEDFHGIYSVYSLLLQIHEYVLKLPSLRGTDLKLLTPIDGKTAVETAVYRGPAFGRIAAKLFLRACQESNLASELRNFLQNSEYINDHTVSSKVLVRTFIRITDHEQCCLFAVQKHACVHEGRTERAG